MNSYIIPICDLNLNKVFIKKISARSENECKEKLMNSYRDLSDSDEYETFKEELDSNDVIIGEITDVETL